MCLYEPETCTGLMGRGQTKGTITHLFHCCGFILHRSLQRIIKNVYINDNINKFFYSYKLILGLVEEFYDLSEDGRHLGFFERGTMGILVNISKVSKRLSFTYFIAKIVLFTINKVKENLLDTSKS